MGGWTRPLLAVLDEAANICRTADLLQLYSPPGFACRRVADDLAELRPRRAGLGRAGMRALWSAVTIKLLDAGLDEGAIVEDISRLVGDDDVPAESWTSGQGRAVGPAAPGGIAS